MLKSNFDRIIFEARRRHPSFGLSKGRRILINVGRKFFHIRAADIVDGDALMEDNPRLSFSAVGGNLDVQWRL